jgi:hypothetical protein
MFPDSVLLQDSSQTFWLFLVVVFVMSVSIGFCALPKPAFDQNLCSETLKHSLDSENVESGDYLGFEDEVNFEKFDDEELVGL